MKYPPSPEGAVAPLVRKRQGFGGVSASQATSAVALIRIHPWVNPWSSAKADKNWQPSEK